MGEITHLRDFAPSWQQPRIVLASNSGWHAACSSRIVTVRPSRRIAIAAFAATLAFGALRPTPLRAGATDPTLAIGQVRAQPAGAAALVEVLGMFGFDDVVQVAYPLSLVLHHDASFVRYPIGNTPESGTLAQLADGLATSEIAALESAGTPEASAEIVRIEPGRLVVSLPPSLASAGTITAQLYVAIPGEGTFVSNAVTVAVVAGGGA